MTACTSYSAAGSALNFMGWPSALSVMVSGSPGFQPFTSTANIGSGANQLGPAARSAMRFFESSTNTRPVNGWSLTLRSKVTWNSSGLASPARVETTLKSRHSKATDNLRGDMDGSKGWETTSLIVADTSAGGEGSGHPVTMDQTARSAE